MARDVFWAGAHCTFYEKNFADYPCRFEGPRPLAPALPLWGRRKNLRRGHLQRFSDNCSGVVSVVIGIVKSLRFTRGDSRVDFKNVFNTDARVSFLSVCHGARVLQIETAINRWLSPVYLWRGRVSGCCYHLDWTRVYQYGVYHVILLFAERLSNSRFFCCFHSLPPRPFFSATPQHRRPRPIVEMNVINDMNSNRTTYE